MVTTTKSKKMRLFNHSITWVTIPITFMITFLDNCIQHYSNYFYCILKVGKSNVLCHVYSMGLVRYKHFNLKTGHICPTSSKTLSSKMKISLFIYHINFAFFPN